MRIRCQKCQRIRVLFREQSCRACWRKQQPRYRVVKLPNGQVRQIGSAKIALQQGRSKGANALHASGLAHRWTSASARLAAQKMWRMNPVNKRIGVRLGRPAKNRSAVDHAVIRKQHTGSASGDVWYSKASRIHGPANWRVKTSTGSRIISERAALIRLGYLPNPRNFVPKVLLPYPQRSNL